MASPLVIKETTIFDSLKRVLVPLQTVIIDGGRVSAVASQVGDYPAGARVIDGRGKFVVPGLVDAHVHLVHRIKRADLSGIEMLPHFLAAGVTSVRCAGDRTEGQAVVANYAETFPHSSPRIFLASDPIDGIPFHNDLGINVADPNRIPEVLDKMAADLAGRKLSTLKLYVGIARTVAQKAIAEGRGRGMTITAHLPDGPPINPSYRAEHAIDDGLDCLEHITSVLQGGTQPSEVVVAKIKQRGVLVDPTLVVFRNMVLLSDLPEIENHPDNDRVNPKLKAHWTDAVQEFRQAPLDQRMKTFADFQQATRSLHEAGVTLLVGSDTPEPFCPPGWGLHQELELLVASGVPAAVALSAATHENARAVKMDAELGSVTVGKIADLVILEADPTTDIRNTRRIHTVIHDGVEVFSADHGGAIYAIRPDGRLHWYKDNNRSGGNGPNAQTGWAPSSGSQISFGWEIFERVFYGGDGIIYAVSPKGRLLWYKDDNRSGGNGPNAQTGWAPGSGSQISFGWEIFERVFYGGWDNALQ